MESTSNRVAVDGSVVRMRGSTFIIPPLTFKQIKKVRARLAPLMTMIEGTLITDEAIDGVTEVIESAAAPNYPNMTVDAWSDLIDVGNFSALLTAVMGGSGLLQSKDGEVPGEAPAGA